MDDFEALGIPILLREARGAFGTNIRRRFKAAGLPLLPVQGAWILGGLHSGEASFEELLHQRKSSLEKNKTLDELVAAGYIVASQGSYELTDLGHKAAALMGSAVAEVGDLLDDAIGKAGVATFRKALLVLIDYKESLEDQERLREE